MDSSHFLCRFSRPASLVIFMICASGSGASAQQAPASATIDTDRINSSNNPLNPSLVVNLQNYYIPALKGLPDLNANLSILRALTPFEVGGIGNLLRTSIPLVGRPEADGGMTQGIGDLTMFDILVMQTEPFGWGLGPLFVAPTADDDRYGAGKWQAGGAAAFAASQDWGLFGTLATYQHSFAGNEDRPTVNSATIQPFVFVNLEDGFYLQSTGAWSFDFENHDYYTPVGLGLGKHWAIDEDFSINTYVEPQYSLFSSGDGNPRWQIFAGINFQYSLAGVKRKRSD